MPGLLRGGGPLVPPARAARLKPFRTKLTIPRVVEKRAFRLPIVEAEVGVLPGPKTRMWTYGGEFPGPTIRRPSGQPTRARFTHRLPKEAGELTVHLHGAHNRSSEDGQPGGLTKRQPRSLYCDLSPRLTAAESGNDLLIRPGASRTYGYDFTENGNPERATMLWYHDHRLDRTGRNVWNGLAGMWILDDDVDAALPLPRGRREIPLLIADRSFDRHNQLTDPFGGHAPNDGVTGRYALVNGAVLPFHRVEGCRHRVRVLNASNFRTYNLALTRGVTFTQIGTEGGLMPAPLNRREVVVGPGERVDLIVDFSGVAGRDVELRSRRRPGAPNQRGAKTWNGPLMQFKVGRRVNDSTSVPALLRPLPDWVAEASREPQHDWRITIGSGFTPSWLINGRTFDPSYVDVRPTLGTTATWRLINETPVPHLIHPHHTSWYLLSRNGRPPPPFESCLKDTFYVGPEEEIVFAGKFSDHAGKYVIHCHMLDHEDHGLMSQFETVI